ncbi:MFS transporter [Echinicola strongylocentroti]|uniref:MFS transporter n=1 Tax=Echinicola strongylocentroti TaxID=1795355 RepID=UPI001B878123|nr:MFS transporter [Echinicola strongylocentroti]
MKDISSQTLPYGKILPVLLSFVVMGFVDIVGVSTGYAQKEFDLSPEMAQLIPSMVFVWFFVLSVPISILQNKVGKRKVLLAGIGATALGMAIPFVSFSYGIFLCSFVLLGIGNTLIQVSSNPLLREVVTAEKYPSILSVSQFIKAISSLLGPLLVAMLASRTGDWKNVFLVYGAVAICTGAWLAKTPIKETHEQASAGFKDCFRLLKDPVIAFMVFAIFLTVGIDVGMNTNIQGVLVSKFDLTLEDASLGISLYFFSLLVSRLLGAVILGKMSHVKFLKWSGWLTVIAFVCLMVSPSLETTLASIILVGLASANLFPLIFALTINRTPKRSNEISGLMTMAIVGGAVVPFIMGLIQKSAGVDFVFLVPAIAAVVLSFSYLKFGK